MWPRIEAHHDALAGRAVLTDAMLGHVLLELRFGLLGDAAQRQFAQRCQVAFAKKVVQRSLDAFRRIDVAMLHALAQSMRRNVDQLHFFSLVDISPHALRQRMKHGNIYPPERIETALNHFFREGNLMALRELALRLTAQKT